jgi:hypothetical protein
MLITPPASAMAAEHPSGEGPGGPPTVHVLTNDVVAPVQLAVHGGAIYIGDAGRSALIKIGEGVVVQVPKPAEINGVDLDPADRTLAYATVDRQAGKGAVTIQRPRKAPVVVDTAAFEKKNNPDGKTLYGSPGASACVQAALAQIPFESPRPASYHGLVGSRPYAVAADGHGGWYVADSAANDVLRIDAAGKISLVAVLPSQPHTFTEQDATALGLPRCIVGVRYAFDAVPTDVEVAPNGDLYVSTLPGGPPNLNFGARGSIYRVDRKKGTTVQVVTGLGGAVNLAIGSTSELYVAELFSGQISMIVNCGTKPVMRPLLRLPNVVAVEYDSGRLYASTLAPGYVTGKPTGPGSVVEIGRPGAGSSSAAEAGMTGQGSPEAPDDVTPSAG